MPGARREQPLLATHVQDWRDKVIYQVLVDRFADGDVEQRLHDPARLARAVPGGDWLGIQDHLDYLQQLGVTTLWIAPVVVNVDADAGVDGVPARLLGAGPDAPEQALRRHGGAAIDDRGRARSGA